MYHRPAWPMSLSRSFRAAASEFYCGRGGGGGFFQLICTRHSPPPPPTHPLSRYVVIDLSFCIEPRETDMLPEALFASIRLSRMNIGQTSVVPADKGDMILGACGVHEGPKTLAHQ